MTIITEITITPVKPNNGLIAIASCIMDGKYRLNGIGIFTRMKGGYRITYPTKKISNGSVTLHYPINKECGATIEDAIIGKYEEDFERYLNT